MSRISYLHLVLLWEDQIFRVIVLQACHVFTDLLPYFCPADVVHELFEHIGFVVRLVDGNCNVDLV